jgi:hypothetical protein
MVLIVGNIFPAKRDMVDQPVKREAEPVILEVQPGTEAFQPVRMDTFGIVSFVIAHTDFRPHRQGLILIASRRNEDWVNESI